jgi:hypothetical protein
MLALLGPASSAHGRNASELMHPADMRLGPESDVRELAGTLSRVLDELEPLRALLPALGRLPAALSALDSLPRIQEMASRAVQMSAQNKVCRQLTPCQPRLSLLNYQYWKVFGSGKLTASGYCTVGKEFV